MVSVCGVSVVWLCINPLFVIVPDPPFTGRHNLHIVRGRRPPIYDPYHMKHETNRIIVEVLLYGILFSLNLFLQSLSLRLRVRPHDLKVDATPQAHL